MIMKLIHKFFHKESKLEPMSLVLYNFDSVPQSWVDKMPFKKSHLYLFLGEVKQMPGHGIFLDIATNKIYSCYHIDEFILATEEQV